MSLKAINVLIAAAGNMSAQFRLGDRAEAARIEAKALEEAARVLAVNGLLDVMAARANARERTAIAVLKRIAKETE